MVRKETDTRIFIMAQGIQSRMPSAKTRKQLLKVGGQPLIARTIGQIRSHSYKPPDCPRSIGMEPIVVGWPDMEPVVEDQYGCRMITLRYPGVCILDGMHGTDPYWSDERNIFLLGDVVFSREAIHTILTCEHDLMFFGTGDIAAAAGELFAYVMAGDRVRDTAEMLMRVECRYMHATSGRTERGQGGHLRNLLWAWMRCLGLQKKDWNAHYSDEIYTPISDWTNDLDTDKDLVELLPVLDQHAWEERNAIEDD